MRINSSFFFAFTLILLLSPTVHPFGSYPTANLSTTWTNNDSYGQPMLLRGTNVAQFACGFFCVAFCDFNEKNQATYIFAVFVSGTNEFSWKSEVVWSANGDHPVRDNAILNFTETGDLMLKDGDGSIVWTTDTAGKSVASMNLTETENLVLFDHQNSVVWQSFDYPTDCLLPGQKMSQGQKLKSSVLLTNSSGQEGMYSLQVTDKGVFAYVESNPPQAYYNMFDYAYVNDANKGRRNIRFLNGSLSFFIDSYERSDPVDAISIQRALSIQYMKLMPNGHLNLFEWQSQGWTVVADLLENTYVGECGYPLVCGRNGICSTSQQCICPLKEYFRPVNDGQPNQGCSQITQLSCSSTQDQQFIKLENTKYFTSIVDMEGVDVETCKQACLNNCSCKAAFFQYSSNASSGECYLPSELFTMKTVDQRYFNASAFIKVQNVRSHRVAIVIGSTIGSFVLMLAVAIGFIMYVVHKRKRDAEIEEEYLDQFPGMPTRFSYEELKTATENFSKKLGEGGFGSVFEGSLKDTSKIAVKRLEGLSHIKKSFLAEVQSIGSIHHVNTTRKKAFNDTHCVSLMGTDDTQKRVVEAPVINKI